MDSTVNAVGPPDRARPVGRQCRIVWLAGYPKSGNTWRRFLLSNFMSRADQPVAVDKLQTLPTGPDAAGLPFLDEWIDVSVSDFSFDEIDQLRPAVWRAVSDSRRLRADPSFFVVHDAFRRTTSGAELFPDEVTAGALYLIRNPLDVAVSWAFFRAAGNMDAGVAFVNGPDAYADGRFRVPEKLIDWSSHVRSWLDAPFPVLVARYEDVLADPAGQLAGMVGFLGLEGDKDEERLRRAVAFSSFDRLRNEEGEVGFLALRTGVRFFRSGRQADWRRHLSQAQVDKIVDRHSAVMTRWGYLPGERVQ